MNQRQNEKKLVDAFKTFFQKTINPHVSTNQSVMNEWKYFSRLISTDPIDISQIEFYLLLANKTQNVNQQPPPPNQYRSSAVNEMNQMKFTSPQISSQKMIP